MAVERYQAGRPYVRRRRVRIAAESLPTEDGAAALAECFREMAKGATLEGRVADTIRWAKATLARAGASVRPSDPHWRRTNEYKSPEWYAVEILQTWDEVRAARDGGDIDLALNLAAEVGVLATEAKFIAYKMGISRAGGEAERDSAKIQHEEWCREALAIWSRDREKKISVVATEIDPARWQRVRHVIAHLNPNPRKSK